MMHGTLNTDRLCRVIEQILSERDESEVKVAIICKPEIIEDTKQIDKTA